MRADAPASDTASEPTAMTDRTSWWSRLADRVRGEPPSGAAPDAAVALELAIADLREQHRMIVDQAAQIVAATAQEQALLDRAIVEHERLTASARQAVRSADEAGAEGRADEAARWETTAEALATRILSTEREIEERQAAVATADEAARRAREVVDRSAAAVRARITAYQRLRSDLDAARLQEHLNDTLRQLDPTAGGTAATTADLERSIEARLATARALTEIRSEPVSAHRLQLEQELSQLDARTVVSGMRRDLPTDAAAAAGSEPGASAGSGGAADPVTPAPPAKTS